MPILLVALLREPRNRASRVHHRLAAGLHRPADVCADDVVGASELGRPPRVVIGQRQAQCAHPESIEQTAQAHVPVGSRIPLRQTSTARASPPGRGSRRPGACRVCFETLPASSGNRAHEPCCSPDTAWHGARKRQRACCAVYVRPERVVRCVWGIEEPLAVGDSVRRPVEEDLFGCCLARMAVAAQSSRGPIRTAGRPGLC